MDDQAPAVHVQNPVFGDARAGIEGRLCPLAEGQSGIGYFQAVTALAKVYRQGVTTNNFNPVSLPANVQQYWTDMLQPLQPGGAYQLGVGLGPTQTGCRTPGQLINSTTNPIVAV